MACNLTDKNIKNRVFEYIPNALAEQIEVDLTGNENKEALLEKIKSAVVKKRLVFLYCMDLHQLTQGQGKDPERYAARIKQAASACCFTTDSGTANYGPDLMGSIFILGLEDVFKCEQLFKLLPDPGKTTVEFKKLVRAASERATAKDNCAEAANTSVCGVSGDKSKTKLCENCNTTNHSSSGFSEEVRKKDSFVVMMLSHIDSIILLQISQM